MPLIETEDHKLLIWGAEAVMAIDAISEIPREVVEKVQEEYDRLRRDSEALGQYKEAIERVTTHDPYIFEIYTPEAAYGFDLAMKIVKSAIADAEEGE